MLVIQIWQLGLSSLLHPLTHTCHSIISHLHHCLKTDRQFLRQLRGKLYQDASQKSEFPKAETGTLVVSCSWSVPFVRPWRLTLGTEDSKIVSVSRCVMTANPIQNSTLRSNLNRPSPKQNNETTNIFEGIDHKFIKERR